MNPVEISTVPAKDGFEWIRLAFRLFRMQWMRYCALSALFILVSQVAGVLTGGILTMFLKPILSVGFLAAAWHQERGETPEVSHLFAGFRSNIKALLPMGLLYLFGVLVALAIGAAVTGLDLEALRTSDPAAGPPHELALQFMLVVIVCMLPINAMLWFAPALVVFSDAGFIKAISLSFHAWTRNILAILVYGLSLLGYSFILSLAMAPIMLFIGGSVQLVILMMVLVPILSIFMISDYVSYRRVFHRSERLQPSTADKTTTP
jgi:hypothetical protein